MMTRLLLLGLLVLLTSSLFAASKWLPPEVREAMIVELAKGLREVDYGKQPTPEELLAAAARGVDDIVARLEREGVDGVIDNAPALTNIGLPTTDNRFAQALGAYGICSVTLHPELATDAEQRLFVAFGIVTVVIISAFLRDAHLATGGNDETLKEYLTSAAMEKVGREVQSNENLRNKITRRCGPILAGLLE